MQLGSENTIHKNARILMVDDNPKNLQILGNTLAPCHYDIEYALNGQAALSWVKKKAFDLILLDIMMPEMDGFEFCKIFKADESHKNIPVIFLTAQTDMNSVIQGFEMGGVDYINKPFNKQELLARVSTHLELRNSRNLIVQNALEFEEKNKLINYSLTYSERIQKAVMLRSNKSLDCLRETFLIFKPKDVVSGDFYWSREVKGKLFIAVMDCTGHGVPGALMSMLGMTFLNEAVMSENIEDPGKILDRMREKVINTLGQEGIIAEVHDGMDGAIITIDRGFNTLDFAGGFSSLYIIREGHLIIQKGDPMPVGTYNEMKNFNSRQMPLLKDDLIYLFTDGYVDQFGGENNVKFKSHAFRKLLLSIHQKPMTLQKELLDQHFNRWKGKYEQVDDVTILGIKI
jgi:phosphoserine phosphatase RsbU/P